MSAAVRGHEIRIDLHSLGNRLIKIIATRAYPKRAIGLKSL